MKSISRIPKYIRVVVPSLLIVAWFALAGIGGPVFGKISEVASNDQSSFLPASAESTKLNQEIKKFQDENSIPAIIVFSNDDKELSAQNIDAIKSVTQSAESLPGVSGKISPPISSEDNKAVIVVFNVATGTEYKEFVAELKTKLDNSEIAIDYKVTGPVGFLTDLSKAFAGIDGLLLGVALAVVFVILLIVYRSPILPFVMLLNSVFALCAAILVVFYLAKLGVITLNGQVQGILFILVIGAATDYSLLYIARYREELTKHKKTYQAIIESLKRSFEPILAAGGTVIAGLLCLLLSDLNSNKALGPVGAIGIVFAITATITFLPSMLFVFGRKIFWPRVPLVETSNNKRNEQLLMKGVWPKIARVVRNHSRRVWVLTTLVLVVCAIGVTQLRADGVAQSDLILGTSDAREGQQMISEHFPGGSGTPTQIITAYSELDESLAQIKSDAGVSSARVVTNSFSFRDATPKIVDDKVLIEATLKDTADSAAAQNTVERLRTKIHAVDGSALVGGATAVQLDTRKSSERDRAIVIPAVLVVITIILMVLLRSILAPLLLLLTTILSFAAILGIAAIVFNTIWQLPGADPSVVLYAFVFLVALGIDYNIFLMTRVREESLKIGTRKGTLLGLIVTGSVITSAGIVLAATFAALAVIPILFLLQLSFIVALGVLIDTVIVRSLLVPAAAYDIGDKVWWPSRKFKTNK